MKYSSGIKVFLIAVLAEGVVALTPTAAAAMSTADCVGCHGDPAITQQGGG